MTAQATTPRPPFGGPQVVGYGYRWAMVAAAVTLTRTANGRRHALRRYPAPGNPPGADPKGVAL